MISSRRFSALSLAIGLLATGFLVPGFAATSQAAGADDQAAQNLRAPESAAASESAASGDLPPDAPADAVKTWEKANSDKRGTWTFLVENDVAAGTDRHYTNGLHLGWLSASGEAPTFVGEVASFLPFLLSPEGKKRIGYTIGQSMFTPSEISISEPQANDRPWAGWLYAGVALLSETPKTLESLELDIGVVGPAAQAEFVQSKWHHLIGATQPRGWNNQLDNEPAIVLIYEKKWREDVIRFAGPDSDYGIDVTPVLGGAIGNVFTYASAGLSLRIGENLPSDFGPPRIRPSLPGSGFFDLADRFGWYIFGSAEGRAVARNIFLDGNTFTDGPSVDKKPFVGDLQVGLAIMFDQVRVTLAQIYRTREFEGQNEPDRFATMSLSLKF